MSREVPLPPATTFGIEDGGQRRGVIAKTAAVIAYGAVGALPGRSTAETANGSASDASWAGHRLATSRLAHTMSGSMSEGQGARLPIGNRAGAQAGGFCGSRDRLG